jgi:hypothetical protein
MGRFPYSNTAVTDRRLTLNLRTRIYRKAPTTTLADCQSRFIRNLRWLSTNVSYYQSVATIDHFPQLSRLRLRCIERSFTASQFNWMVRLSHLRLGKYVSVAIVTHATEKSATANPVPSLCFPAYRTHTSTATRQEQADATVRLELGCLSWPSIVAPIAYAFCLSPCLPSSPHPLNQTIHAP